MSKRTAVVAATGMAALLAAGLGGCGLAVPSANPTHSTPAPVVSTPVTTPSASVTPTVSVTPSVTPSESPAVEATGRLSFHKANLVSKDLAGTCAVVAGKPTVTLADHSNDFYTTVDLVIVLTADGGDVASVVGNFGEDQEKLVTRKMVHPDKGTSARLSASGAEYRISGNAMLYEGDAKSGSLIPFTITATCATSDWLG
ncbi:MAG TPA: hypothetical protein VGK17_03360 [Propionicimonas sp.]|jgi:hypothetical protein